MTEPSLIPVSFLISARMFYTPGRVSGFGNELMIGFIHRYIIVHINMHTVNTTDSVVH